MAFAATSPTLGGSSSYSILGGAAVTNTGTTTISGSVGVSPGTSIDGGITAGGGTHSNDASAIAAQADALTVFGALDQTCDYNYGAQDLTLISPLGPGVYCSSSSFSLSGGLTLTGSGVWIFKTVSTLITSPGSSVTGSDPCNVWWRVGSAATLGTTTSFIGNIVTANVADTTSMNTGAILDGRILAQAAATVALHGNGITGPTCYTPPVDICANIEGVQTSVPEGQHLDASGLNCINFSQAGPPSQGGGSTTTTTTTSTGQVLGATTLASTGSFNSNVGLVIIMVGSVITIISLYVFKKRFI